MSYVRIFIKPTGSTSKTEVTRDVIKLSNLSEYNDESNFFSGVFRRGNLNITLDNNDNKYTTKHAKSIFQELRENSEVELFYNFNDPAIDDVLLFRGLITEGSTENDLTNRNLNLTIVDSMKYLNDIELQSEDLKTIDTLYKTNFSSNIKLDKNFISCFLYHLIFTRKQLNSVFNIFTGETPKTFQNINTTIESVFSPNDSYYESTNVTALSVLSSILTSLNSYLVLEYFTDKTQLFIKARPTTALNPPKTTLFNTKDILELKNQTDGFNKLFNSVQINDGRTYKRQDSIDAYGVRVLNTRSYLPSSSFVASTYLDYFSEPKQELNMVVRLRAETLDLRIGDVIKLNVSDLLENFTIQPFNSVLHIISRSINFRSDTIDLRLREL